MNYWPLMGIAAGRDRALPLRFNPLLVDGSARRRRRGWLAGLDVIAVGRGSGEGLQRQRLYLGHVDHPAGDRLASNVSACNSDAAG